MPHVPKWHGTFLSTCQIEVLPAFVNLEPCIKHIIIMYFEKVHNIISKNVI